MVRLYIILLVILLSTCLSWGQSHDTMHVDGQVSAWTGIHEASDPPWKLGGRYLPSLQYGRKQNNSLLDMELSANINGEARIHPFDSAHFDRQLKAYRVWARYSTAQWELRLGLQKINFGSAAMLRPLMWFDQVDPRDPLQLTDGVWGLLGRYYWMNNANMWLWVLYPSNKPKTWELYKTNAHFPELGARLQYPIPRGEAGLTYHWRMADTRDNALGLPDYAESAENRLGVDVRLDVELGLWFEASLTQSSKPMGMLSHQKLINIGTDYTFKLGNGLNLILEHLLVSYAQNIASLDKALLISGLSLNYPLNLLDNIQVICYHDWKHSNTYNFISINRKYNSLAFHLMAYLNPEQYLMPQQPESGELFSGKGIQLMVVYHH